MFASNCRYRNTDWFWKNYGMRTHGAAVFLWRHPVVKTEPGIAVASAAKGFARTRYYISKNRKISNQNEKMELM